MMKKLPPLIVAFLLYFGTVGATSNPLTLTLPESSKQEQIQTIEPNNNSYSTQRGTNNTPLVVEVQDAHEYEKIRNENLIANGTVVLALVTAFLAWFTFRLWKSTSKLVDDAEKTARRQLRAYVMVPHVSIKNIKQQNGIEDCFVYIAVKNFGQTPATYCKYWVNLSANEYPLKTPLEKHVSNKDGGVGVIAPSDTFFIRTKIPLLSNGNEIHGGCYALYVYGQFSYNDAFGSKKNTDFRFTRNGEGWTSDGEMEVCEEGNEAT